MLLKAATTIAALIPLGMGAQESTTVKAPHPSSETQVLWHEAKALLPTRMVLPPGFDVEHEYTLIIALHGYGSSAEAFQRVGKRLADVGFLVAIPEAAYALFIDGKLGYDWTLHHTGDETLGVRATRLAGLDHLPVVARDLQQRYKIDRVYVLGFSQGAVLALLTGIYNAELFDGVIAFGLPAFDPAWFEGDTLTAGRGVEILLIHGENDERAPLPHSQQARESLHAAGYDVTLRTFPGGHTVPNDQLDFVAKWSQK